MIKRTLKYFGMVILMYCFLCFITPFNTFLRNRSIQSQINYLSHILNKGYDDDLQKRFPEGKLFSNSLLALSTIEFCDKNKISNKKYANIVDNCIQRILSKEAQRIFNPDIKPEYGMFYNGWSNYVFSTYMKSKLFNFSRLQSGIREQFEIIEARIVLTQKDSLRILDSYDRSNWPADNFIGMISLKEKELKEKWINKIFITAKHKSGLIHHSGSDEYLIRGSSSAMITFCLNEIGYSKLEEYSDQFNEIFVDNYFGVQLVKENEDGTSEMDFDSGPVLFGYGSAATIMNIKTQASLGNSAAKFTYGAMNVISIPVNIFQKKYHLFKKEPMLDLFMLWGCTEI